MDVRLLFLCVFSALVKAQFDKGVSFENIYKQCTYNNGDFFRCMQIEVVKIADRALHIKEFDIMDGVTIVQNKETSRGFKSAPLLQDVVLEKLKSQELNEKLLGTIQEFFQTHKLDIRMSKMIEEGRKKKKDNHHHGLLLAAAAIKSMFLTMAYKSIAMMAGAAILIGKISLILSALLGLKKLISHSPEKTTFEIIKHPVYSQSHTSSHDVIGEDSSYKRSVNLANEQNSVHERVYNGYVPHY